MISIITFSGNIVGELSPEQLALIPTARSILDSDLSAVKFPEGYKSREIGLIINWLNGERSDPFPIEDPKAELILRVGALLGDIGFDQEYKSVMQRLNKANDLGVGSDFDRVLSLIHKFVEPHNRVNVLRVILYNPAKDYITVDTDIRKLGKESEQLVFEEFFPVNDEYEWFIHLSKLFGSERALKYLYIDLWDEEAANKIAGELKIHSTKELRTAVRQGVRKILRLTDVPFDLLSEKIPNTLISLDIPQITMMIANGRGRRLQDGVIEVSVRGLDDKVFKLRYEPGEHPTTISDPASIATDDILKVVRFQVDKISNRTAIAEDVRRPE